MRKRITAFFEGEGAEVTSVGTVEAAKRCLKDLSFDFALIDIHLPDGLGLSLLEEELFSATTSVVIMTAEGGVETAVKAIQLGAGDYLSKPFDLDELPIVFKRCQQKRQSQRRDEHQSALQEAEGEALFFGESLQTLKSQLERILETDQRLSERLPPVLIEGETGTGKTTFARWLHRNGPRRNKQLVDVNCSTLPDTLAESELFGHEKGAFTDARSARIGLFEAADGGTLFLDEIPSLSLPIQAKILTAIEDGVIRRVGGNKPIPVNVRLIVATNLDLHEQIAQNQFREDLYHRLNLLQLKIPPLRERGKDLEQLSAHLIQHLCRRYKVANKALSPEAKKQLMSYAWPGNIRELSHQLERAFILNPEGDVSFNFIEANPAAVSSAGSADDWLNPAWQIDGSDFDLEAAINRFISLALAHTDNNVSAAARLLGVSRDYIRYRQNKTD